MRKTLYLRPQTKAHTQVTKKLKPKQDNLSNGINNAVNGRHLWFVYYTYSVHERLSCLVWCRLYWWFM